MLHAAKLSRAWMSALGSRPIDARTRLYPRVAGFVATLAVLAVAATILWTLGADGARLADVRRMQYRVVWTLLAGGSIAIALMMTLAEWSARSVDEALEQAAARLDALAEGDIVLEPEMTTGGAHARLHRAICRMARIRRANVASANAIASGSVILALPGQRTSDPVSVALARVAGTIQNMADVATRISRGDLTATVTPQGAGDALGHAHAAMARRIASAMREIEVAKTAIAAAAERLHDESAVLASISEEEAEQIRRSAEQVALVARQAASTASRSEALELRAASSAQLVRDGSHRLKESLGSLEQVFQESNRVHALARATGMLAVRVSQDSSLAHVEREARELVQSSGESAVALTRLTARGAYDVSDASALIERVETGVQEEQALIRELGGVSREQAQLLRDVDGGVTLAHRTAAQGAATARRVNTQAAALLAQARRLDTALGRFRQPAPAVPKQKVSVVNGPVLYVTPPHAYLAFPKLALAGE